MRRRSGADLAHHAAKSFRDELTKAPSGAVAGEHAQIMQMQIRIPMRLRDLCVVDLAQPVVGCDGAGVGEDQTADGICDRGVLLHAPVVDAEVVVHQLLVVKKCASDIAELFTLLAVQNVGLGHIRIARFTQNALHAVLNILHRNQIVLDLRLKLRCDTQRQHLDHTGVMIPAHCLKCLCDRIADLGNVKFRNASVSLCYPIHNRSSFVCVPRTTRKWDAALYAASHFNPKHVHLSISCAIQISLQQYIVFHIPRSATLGILGRTSSAQWRSCSGAGA